MLATLGSKKTDWLPVKITYQKCDQLLGVPTTDGDGKSMAENVYQLLKKWNIIEKLQACCFDTTGSNTGCWNGAATLLEQLIGRSLLWLPCRHHIYELILKAVFELKVR